MDENVLPARTEMRVRSFLLLGALVSLLAAPPRSAFAEYPEIRELSRDDVLYVQLQRDIEAHYRATARREAGQDEERGPALTFFRYRPHPPEDLLSVAARLNLPYETLSTLNGIKSMEGFGRLEQIILPNQPGVFVPFEPENDLEQIMLSWRTRQRERAVSVTIQLGTEPRSLLFFPGDRFHPVERAYFLRILFRTPLPGGHLTSGYGMRSHPFGGHPQFHNGIDLAAPEGTEVLAAREGRVKETGYHRVYGNYVLLSHDNGYETLYGHLSEIAVSLNNRVGSGTIIGRVGTTGWSTGPHLHFEIRKKGVARDPMPLIPLR